MEGGPRRWGGARTPGRGGEEEEEEYQKIRIRDSIHPQRMPWSSIVNCLGLGSRGAAENPMKASTRNSKKTHLERVVNMRPEGKVLYPTGGSEGARRPEEGGSVRTLGG